MPEDPSVAARPAPFWKIAVGATAVALVAGIVTIVGDMFSWSNPDHRDWSILVVPFLMLLAGGFVFGRISRRRPWLVSLFLIVPNPMVLILLAHLAIDGLDNRSAGFALITLGALSAAPLIGVWLPLALTRLSR